MFFSSKLYKQNGDFVSVWVISVTDSDELPEAVKNKLFSLWSNPRLLLASGCYYSWTEMCFYVMSAYNTTVMVGNNFAIKQEWINTYVYDFFFFGINRYLKHDDHLTHQATLVVSKLQTTYWFEMSLVREDSMKSA